MKILDAGFLADDRKGVFDPVYASEDQPSPVVFQPAEQCSGLQAWPRYSKGHDGFVFPFRTWSRFLSKSMSAFC